MHLQLFLFLQFQWFEDISVSIQVCPVIYSDLFVQQRFVVSQQETLNSKLIISLVYNNEQFIILLKVFAKK